jgi:hypothetical protein
MKTNKLNIESRTNLRANAEKHPSQKKLGNEPARNKIVADAINMRN